MRDDNKKGWFDDDPEWEELKKRSENPPSDSRIDRWMDRFEVWLDDFQWPWQRRNRRKIKEQQEDESPIRAGYFSNLGKSHQDASRKRPFPGQSQGVKQSDSSTKSTDKVEVSINVTLPRFTSVRRKLSENIISLKSKIPKIKIRRPTAEKKYFVLGAALLVAVGVPLIIGSLKNTPENKSTASEEQANTEQRPNDAQFRVFRSLSENATQPRFDQDKQITSFQDTVNGINVTVTQQALPEEFKTNTADEIKNFATSQNFKDELSVDEGVAYIGLSVNGPQSVIYQRDQTLIFLQSIEKMSNSKWTNYLNKLQ